MRPTQSTQFLTARSDKLFPSKGQDITFLEDVIDSLEEERVGKLMKLTWNSRVDKPKVRGIHGTLFIGLRARSTFYPTRREADMDRAEVQNAIRGIPAETSRGSSEQTAKKRRVFYCTSAHFFI